MKLFFLFRLKIVKTAIIVIVAAYVIDSSIDPSNNFLGAYDTTVQTSQGSYLGFIIKKFFHSNNDVSDHTESAGSSKIKGPATYYCTFGVRISADNEQPSATTSKFSGGQMKFSPPTLAIQGPPPKIKSFSLRG